MCSTIEEWATTRTRVEFSWQEMLRDSSVVDGNFRVTGVLALCFFCDAGFQRTHSMLPFFLFLESPLWKNRGSCGQ